MAMTCCPGEMVLELPSFMAVKFETLEILRKAMSFNGSVPTKPMSV